MKLATAASMLFLAACSSTGDPDSGAVLMSPVAAVRPGATRTVGDFARVVSLVEPAAERFCREENPAAPARSCDFRIFLDTDPAIPPNAFQSEGEDGRPDITLAASLLAEMQSDDEIAFVLAHEASHHVAGHIARQRQRTVMGALILGGIVAAAGSPYGGPATEEDIQNAMDLGAYVGARSYSQTYELQADTLGAYIAARAGYDPVRGAAIFERPALMSSGGPPLLTTHPPSAQREANVAAVAAEIRRQLSLGLLPRPEYAGRTS